MPSNKENFISIYLSPEDYEKIEELKARRRGRGATKTAVVRDIVHYFFAMDDAQIQTALQLRSDKPITLDGEQAKANLKTCKNDPRHIWMADTDNCPYCAYTPEQRAEYARRNW